MPSTSAALAFNSLTPVKRRKIKQIEHRRQTKSVVQNYYNFFYKLLFVPNVQKIGFTITQNVTAEACGVFIKKCSTNFTRKQKREGNFIDSIYPA